MESGQDSSITIVRERAYTYAARSFKVFVDQVQAGTVANGDEVTLRVPPGRHGVHVGIDFYRSGTVAVDLAPGEAARLTCGAGSLLSAFTAKHLFLTRTDGGEGGKGAAVAEAAPHVFPVVSLDDTANRVPSAVEDVHIPSGVSITVKRSRTVEHSVDVQWGSATEGQVTAGIKTLISGSIRKEVSDRLGITRGESETTEYEVELKGVNANCYRLTWVDTWRTGMVEFSDGNATRMLPFRFRERTELEVHPVDPGETGGEKLQA
ncbi:MAG TPA: hypothetical protein VHG93_06430 [Longimicrobium sp.]|nr:hypothetical protein [Longimicrobium sp.]